METKLDRRRLLRTAGGASLAAAFGARALDLLAGDAEAADASSTCLLTPEATEGPFWVEDALRRRNVTEGRPGAQLVIRFTVLDARSCRPIRNADVEIWHCDARGAYSGVAGATTRFLRGVQRSNAAGLAEFLTIFPGWYPGRTPHIHTKVWVGGDEVHTGQIFFDEKLTATVYRQPPYAARGRYDTPHARDLIYRQAGGSRAELKLKRRPAGLPGYVGTIAVGVVR